MPDDGDDVTHDTGSIDSDDHLADAILPPRAVNWRNLTADEAEHDWLALNRWVDWLRITYALPPTIVPPFWHRHWELVWELSALHTHWLGAYHPDQHGSAPIGWHADFALARDRLRDWVSLCGTRLDRDRPSRQVTWPGRSDNLAGGEEIIADRDADFVEWVHADVLGRTPPGT